VLGSRGAKQPLHLPLALCSPRRCIRLLPDSQENRIARPYAHAAPLNIYRSFISLYSDVRGCVLVFSSIYNPLSRLTLVVFLSPLSRCPRTLCLARPCCLVAGLRRVVICARRTLDLASAPHCRSRHAVFFPTRLDKPRCLKLGVSLGVVRPFRILQPCHADVMARFSSGCVVFLIGRLRMALRPPDPFTDTVHF
jgi:hypothetical protein